MKLLLLVVLLVNLHKDNIQLLLVFKQVQHSKHIIVLLSVHMQDDLHKVQVQLLLVKVLVKGDNLIEI